MAKKMIIYGVILLLWLVACVVLYVLKLIDWIGVAVSFIFAVPPIFVDLYSTKEESKRKQQLEQIGQLYKFLKYLDDMNVENIRVNMLRQRAGAVNTMGLIDLNASIHKTFVDPTTKAYYIKSIAIVFGKKQCEELYLRMEKDRQGFEKVLEQKMLDLNPTENECDFYKLLLSSDLKKQLFLKRHSEIKETR